MKLIFFTKGLNPACSSDANPDQINCSTQEDHWGLIPKASQSGGLEKTNHLDSCWVPVTLGMMVGHKECEVISINVIRTTTLQKLRLLCSGWLSVLHVPFASALTAENRRVLTRYYNYGGRETCLQMLH